MVRELPVAEVFWDDHLWELLVRMLHLAPVGSLLPVNVNRHLEMVKIIALITRSIVHTIFVLTLEWPDHLIVWCQFIIHSFHVVRTVPLPSEDGLLLLAGNSSVHMSAVLVAGRPKNLPLAGLIRVVHHILGSQEAVRALLMWSGASSDESGNTIVLLAMARVEMLLIERGDGLEVVLLSGGPASHLLSSVIATGTIVDGLSLGHEASNSG